MLCRILRQLFQGQKYSGLLFPVRLLEVAFGGVRLYFKEIVVFSAVKYKSCIKCGGENTYVSLTMVMMGGNASGYKER